MEFYEKLFLCAIFLCLGLRGLITIFFLYVIQFPADILRLTKNLRTLDMSANKLPAIPPAFGKFLMMKNLNLSNNRLGM